MKLTENIELILGDCMELMANTPDKHYDLAIVDPPYGISINMNMGRRKGQIKKHSEKKWDNSTPDEDYFNEIMRVSKNQIIWGGNYFNLPLTKSWIFWDKGVPEGVDFADGELAWTSYNITLKKVKINYSGFRGMDIGGKVHPTQKPVALYKWLLQNYAKEGDKILDTHAGSFSIGIAAPQLGFNLTATEIDKDYFDSAVKRFKQVSAQTDIFTEIRNVEQGKLEL